MHWRYRIKIIEKVYYIFLLALAFCLYKSPSFLHYFVVEIGAYTIPMLSAIIIVFHMAGMYLDN